MFKSPWFWVFVLLGSAAGHVSLDGMAGMVVFPGLEGADALIDEVKEGRPGRPQPGLPVGE